MCLGDSDSLGVFMLSMMRLCMNFLVFLEILRTFEGFTADVAVVRFEWDVD